RGARPPPRRAQRGPDATGSGGGDLPDGHLRGDARRRGRAGGLRQGAGGARRAFSRRGAEVSDRALDAAVDAARAAGQIALKYFHEGVEVTLKPDATPVTRADREAEQAIVEILGRAFPAYGTLGEEFGGHGTDEVRWIIDPIDGTQNFVRGIGFWATLIALEERGEITVGVIHNPVTAEIYTARRGAGAHRNGERLRVSDVGELSRSFFVHEDPTEPLLLAAQPRIGELLAALGVVDRAIAFDALGLDRLFGPEPRDPTPVLREATRVVSWFGARDADFVRRLTALVPDT